MSRVRDVNHPSLWYPFGKFICGLFFRLGWRLHVEGVEHIPAEGPVIIASNHRSLADPPLIGAGIPRVVHFLAKKELFEFKPFGWLITRLNAHPLNRAAGIGALKDAQEILEQGGVVILFPEGRRSKTEELQKPKHGVGMIAVRAKVPVVPAYIHNSGFLSRFKRISVTFGPPIPAGEISDYEKMAQLVMARIQKMKDQFH
jgi:1-acyl-sn-glycerol-3-phosphate acyltransferase